MKRWCDAFAEELLPVAAQPFEVTPLIAARRARKL
jgi:hypothetical protein